MDSWLMKMLKPNPGGSAPSTSGGGADSSDVEATSHEPQLSNMPQTESSQQPAIPSLTTTTPTNPLPMNGSTESSSSMQEPTTPTTEDSFPQMPVTPVRPIVAVDDSLMSSTMSSPAMVHETQVQNPFDESGTIEEVRQQLTESQSADDDEEDVLLEPDLHSEHEDVDDKPSQQLTGASVQTTQTQGVDSRVDVPKPNSSVQLFKKQELLDVLRKQDVSQMDSPQGSQQSRTSSAPPESQASREPQLFGRQSNYILRFHQKLLPPPTMPLHMEILAYIQRWGSWATTIDDYSRRMYLINRVTDKMRDVWAEGIKKGLIPQKAPEGHESMSPAELQQAMEEERGRQAERKKQKRQVSPSKAVVIEIRRNIHVDNSTRKTDRSITAGELADAGVKWQHVQKRVAARLLDPDRVLIEKTTDRLGRNYIVPKVDWAGKSKATKNNPTGRDLLMFCLWEVFRCDIQLPYLENLLDMAQTDEQRDINLEALQTEQKLRDHLMAVALELDPEGEEYISSDDDEEEEDDNDEQQPTSAKVALVPGKRPAEVEVDAEPLTKKAKLEAPTTSVVRRGPQTENSLAAREPLLPVLPIEFTNPDVFRKQVDLIGREIRPKASALLESIGAEPLDETTDRWTPISARLQQSGITVDRLNELILEINTRFAEFKADDKREKQQKEVVRDVEGLPSRLEIWHAIPPEGLTNQELQEAFPEASASNTTWQKLVKSVSRLEKTAGRWLPLKDFPDNEGDESQSPRPAPGFGPSLKIVLKVKNYPGFDPEDYSLETINHTKGFKWRYMSTSTVHQRLSMDDVIEEYVEKRIDADRPKPKGVPRASNHRRGTYEVIGHPDFPESPGVVHGVWEIRKHTDTEDPHLIWFYDGGHREVVDLGFASYGPVPQGTMEEMVQLVEDRKAADLQKQKQQQHEDLGEYTKSPKQKLLTDAPPEPSGRSPAKAPGDPRPKGIINKGGRGGGGRSGKRGGGRGAGAAGQQLSRTAGRKRKAPPLPGEAEDDDDDDDEDDDVVAPRPRRKAARPITYGDDGDDEGDEYVPT